MKKIQQKVSDTMYYNTSGAMKAFEFHNGFRLVHGDGEVVEVGVEGVRLLIWTCDIPSWIGSIVFFKNDNIFPYDSFSCEECGYRCVCR